MDFAPFQRHQMRKLGSSPHQVKMCRTGPGFTSPSPFPSRGFSPPQGIASRVPLRPCFMPQPLIGSWNRWSVPPPGTSEEANYLQVTFTVPVVSPAAEASVEPRTSRGPARCLSASTFQPVHKGLVFGHHLAVGERSRSGCLTIRSRLQLILVFPTLPTTQRATEAACRATFQAFASRKR